MAPVAREAPVMPVAREAPEAREAPGTGSGGTAVLDSDTPNVSMSDVTRVTGADASTSSFLGNRRVSGPGGAAVTEGPGLPPGTPDAWGAPDAPSAPTPGRGKGRRDDEGVDGRPDTGAAGRADGRAVSKGASRSAPTDTESGVPPDALPGGTEPSPSAAAPAPGPRFLSNHDPGVPAGSSEAPGCPASGPPSGRAARQAAVRPPASGQTTGPRLPEPSPASPVPPGSRPAGRSAGSFEPPAVPPRSVRVSRSFGWASFRHFSTRTYIPPGASHFRWAYASGPTYLLSDRAPTRSERPLYHIAPGALNVAHVPMRWRSISRRGHHDECIHGRNPSPLRPVEPPLLDCQFGNRTPECIQSRMNRSFSPHE